MKWRSAVAIFVVAITLAECRGSLAQVSTKPKRVLLLGQKPDGHPATTHEYMAGVRLLGALLSRQPGVNPIVIQADSPWEDGPELLDGADAVVLFLSEGARWVSENPGRLAAFQRLAKRGGGLTCLHWGMGTRDAQPIDDFTALFGGCHGGPDRKYKIVTVTVTPSVDPHPILSGLAPFDVHDEFYYSIKRPAAARILSLRSLITVPIDGRDEMVSWACERQDDGRSFGFTGLHFHSNWKRPEYRRLVVQGILWTLHGSISPDGLNVDLPEPAADDSASSSNQ